MPKLQQQLQIHLYRLPDRINQPALSMPQQVPPCLDNCTTQSHPKLSEPVTNLPTSHGPYTVTDSSTRTHSHPHMSQPAAPFTSSHSPHTTTHSPVQMSESVKQLNMLHTPHKITHSPPELSQPVAKSSSPHLPRLITDTPQRSLRLRLHRLPQSAVRLHTFVSSSSQQCPQSTLHPAPNGVTSNLCFQGQSASKHHDVLTERGKADEGKTFDRTLHVLCQSVDPHAELKEAAKVKRKAARGDPAEEKEDTSVKKRALQNCQTSDRHYVCSQNPAEFTSVNSLSGLTNGFPQKGLLQNKHKIRVDFKVGF